MTVSKHNFKVPLFQLFELGTHSFKSRFPTGKSLRRSACGGGKDSAKRWYLTTIAVGSAGPSVDFLDRCADPRKFQESAFASIVRLVEPEDTDEFDLVAMGRALIANLDWPSLVRRRFNSKRSLHKIPAKSAKVIPIVQIVILH
jgi:hypothetical protein